MPVKVKMKSLGQTVKNSGGIVSEAKVSEAKKRIEYPSLQINSKQMPGLEKLSKDANVVLVLKAEVKGIREADSWDQERFGVGSEDCLVDFKLLEGSVEIMPELKKPKG